MSEPAGQPAEVLALIGDYLDQLAAETHQRLGAVAGVGVTMAGPDGRPITIGASTDLARAVDELQYQLGNGPCLHALRGGGGDYVPSLAEDDRWGSYGPKAAALGAACCLSIPVHTHDSVSAVFKVYTGEVDGLSTEQRELGHEAARKASGGIGLAQLLSAATVELADRANAMDTRRVIDLALGILMERTSCTSEDAFTLLRRYSQTRNVKLRDIAAEVVEAASTGSDPRGGGRAPFLPRGDSPR